MDFQTARRNLNRFLNLNRPLNRGENPNNVVRLTNITRPPSTLKQTNNLLRELNAIQSEERLWRAKRPSSTREAKLKQIQKKLNKITEKSVKIENKRTELIEKDKDITVQTNLGRDIARQMKHTTHKFGETDLGIPRAGAEFLSTQTNETIELDDPLRVIDRTDVNNKPRLDNIMDMIKFLGRSVNFGSMRGVRVGGPQTRKFTISLRIAFHEEEELIWTSVPFHRELSDVYREVEQLLKRYMEQYQTTITITEISYLTKTAEPNPNFDPTLFTNVRGNVRSIAVASKLWYNYSPKSNISCWFHSIVMNKGWKKDIKMLTDDKLIVERAKKCKARIDPTKKGYSNRETMIETCNYYDKYIFKIYGNLYDLEETIVPPSYTEKNKRKFETFEFRKSNGHISALIRKNEIKDLYPDFATEKDTETPKYVNKVIEVEDIDVIKRKFPHKNRDTKYGVFDIETSTNNNTIAHKAYAIGWCSEGLDNYKSVWGLDCIDKWLNDMYENRYELDGTTFYAHNGGKFDLPVVIREGLLRINKWKIQGEKMVELNSAFIGFTIYTEGKDDIKPIEIHFKDSLRMFPCGLAKLCEEFEADHQKLTETITHNMITTSNFHTFDALPKYLEHDVKGLYECIDKFSQIIHNKFQINITKCFTSASLAKKIYFTHYYKPYKTPIYTLSDTQDEFMRKSYFGGRVECFKLGRFKGKLYYYDFTSLYPDVARQLLPYDKPEYVGDVKTLFFGFIRCRVRHTEEGKRMIEERKLKPLHAIKKDSKLIFPVLEKWTELTLFSEEIKYSMNNNCGYEYEFLDGYKFKASKILNEIFNETFKLKQEATANGQDGMTLTYKIINNSIYGFWGLRTKDRDSVKISEGYNGWYDAFVNEKLVGLGYHSGYTFCRMKNDLEIKDFNVAIASAICSYARMKLFKLIRAITEAGGNILYCDTDSIICDYNINENQKILDTFQWDGTGEELGSLKNECDKPVRKHFNKQVLKKYVKLVDKKDDETTLKYMKRVKAMYGKDIDAETDILVKKQNDIDEGQLCFDEVVINGCKFYGTRKTLYDGTLIEDIKCKGLDQKNKENKMPFEELFEINDGKTWNSNPTDQFRCSKSNYITENEEKMFAINIVKVGKMIRQNYTKGKAQEKNENHNCLVNPLII